MAAKRRFRPRHEQRPGEAEGEARPGDVHAARDFDAEIARMTQRAESLRAQMADALTAWLDVTAPWAVDFWERAIAESVQEEPGAVMALDDAVRRAAKEDAARLIANARAHIERRLVDDRHEDWPHLKPQTDPHDHAFRREGARGPFDVVAAKGARLSEAAPEVVAGRLNGVLGDIASVSAHHGFVLEGFGHGDPFGHRGRWHPNREHAPGWSEEMVRAMAAYAVLHERYVETLVEAERIAAEKRRFEASKLWETA